MPIAVPPLGRRPSTARAASALVAALAARRHARRWGRSRRRRPVPATTMKYVPSLSSSMAATVARFAPSNLPAGFSIDVEQSMMMASSALVGAAADRDVAPDGDADDRVDRAGSLGEVGIVVDVNRDALRAQLNS